MKRRLDYTLYLVTDSNLWEAENLKALFARLSAEV